MAKRIHMKKPTAKSANDPATSSMSASASHMKKEMPGSQATGHRGGETDHEFGAINVTGDSPRQRILPHGVRSKLGAAFGSDLSNITFQEGRGPEAAGADALAQGSTIQFANGQFDPHSHAGVELIAHELTHVAQQRSGRVRGNGVTRQPHLEAEAETTAARVMDGRPAGLRIPSSPGATQGAAQSAAPAQPGKSKAQSKARNKQRDIKNFKRQPKGTDFIHVPSGEGGLAPASLGDNPSFQQVLDAAPQAEANIAKFKKKKGH